MKKIYFSFFLSVLLLLTLGATCTTEKTETPQTKSIKVEDEELTPIIASLISEPNLAPMSDGSFKLAYELTISNAASVEVTMENIEIRDADNTDNIIATLEGADLEKNLHIPGTETPSTLFPSSQSGLLMINLTFPDKDSVPENLIHYINVNTGNLSPKLPENILEKVAQTKVDKETPIVISPPLKGEGWLAVAVNDYWYHRATVMPINGEWFAPERWAVDYIQLTPDNLFANNDSTINENYPQYGQEIIAVRDGHITATTDDEIDNAPPNMPEGMTLQKAGGNYVFQDIGDGHSAFYAHMIPGSLKVKQGDYVKAGQVLGLLGNSGNTDAPHLHFHIIEGDHPLAADGVPYVIDSFTITDTVESDDNLQEEFNSPATPLTVTSQDPKTYTDVMPDNLSIITFAE